MEYNRASQSFRISLLAAGNISERTIRNYETDLELFARRFPGAIETWTKDHVLMFLANTKWSASTKLIRWKSLHAFFKFCVSEGFLIESPMAFVPKPKGAKKARRPDSLSQDDIHLLLLMCPEWTWMGLRDRAILLTLWTCPFRLAELQSLLLKDVDLRQFRLRARKSKGGEGYTATLFPDTAQAIDRYLRKRPFDSEALWVSKDGTRMSAHGIQQLLRRIEKRAKEAGFPQHIWAHGFRHLWGTKAVQWGLAVDVTASRMGQKTTDAAELYRQWALEEEGEKQIRIIAGVEKRATA